MRPADDPTFDAKAFVARGYDACADAYAARRGPEEPDWLPLLADRLAPGAAVLDVGCGCGVPIALSLVRRGFAVTGVDISAGQIVRARANVPEAEFLHGDIMRQAFAPAHFDAVVMVYTLFHLPREEQPALLGRLHGWLKPKGWLVATLARSAHAGYVEDDFCGTSMYWSHFAEADYDPILERNGFDIVERRRIGHGYAQGAAQREEIHPLVLARTRPREG